VIPSGSWADWASPGLVRHEKLARQKKNQEQQTVWSMRKSYGGRAADLDHLGAVHGFFGLPSPEPAGAARMETFEPLTGSVSVSNAECQRAIHGAPARITRTIRRPVAYQRASGGEGIRNRVLKSTTIRDRLRREGKEKKP
jgi:hypothetical protein